MYTLWTETGLRFATHLPFPFLDSKGQMDDQNTQGKFFRWEHLRYLMDWIRARSTTHISFPHLDSKQLAETKIFGQFVDARQKIFGRGYSVEL